MKNLKLLKELALTLINTNDFNTQMNSIIRIAGQFTQVSRTYIFIDSADGTSTSNKFEWCNKNIQPKINKLQEISYEIIPSWKKILQKDNRIYSENIHELPDDIVAILEPQGILSIVVNPLYVDGEINGFIGFNECKKQRHWEESELNLLKTISGFISTAYSSKIYHDNLINSEKNFKTLFNTIEDLLIIGNNQGKIIYTNKSVIDKIGYTSDELQDMMILDLHPKEKQNEAQEILTSMFHGEKNYCPLEIQKKNGSILPVETRVWFGSWDGNDCIFGLSKDLSKEQEALQKFTKLFENNPALMAISTMPERIFVDVNTSFINKLGYQKSEIIDKTSIELEIFIQADKQKQITDELKKFGKIQNLELQVKCKNGEILDGLFSGELIDNQGKKYFLTVMVDITEQKRLQRSLDDQRIRLTNIIEGTRLGTWQWNIKSGETIFNDRWAEIVGYTLDELQPININTWSKLVHPTDLQKSNELLEKHFNKKSEYYDFEGRMKHKNGNWIWIHDKGKVIEWDENGKPLMMFGTHAEITEKKEMEEKLFQLSIRDPLTNIFNRRYIFERLNEIFSQFKRNNYHFSISILDIDYFKNLNDTYGHLAGDYILQEFTKIISQKIRSYDLLGRYGGEEFIVIMTNSNKKDTEKKIENIMDYIKEIAFNYDSEELHFTFSTGISDSNDFNHDDISIDKMINKADIRLYIAKNTGRNKIIINSN